MKICRIFLLLAVWLAPARAAELSYNRDIRPILSDNCFHCHGPDASHRKAKLRLDIREDALKAEAFAPGKPDESELIKRILTTDEDDVMPPPDSAKKLTDAQKATLKEWVAQGAKYEAHWAYLPPVKPAVDGNGIDFLVRKQLKARGAEPAKEADRRTLARRLSFDLVGLPANPDDVEAFENDKSSDAYENVVERLLSSPHYGERMAMGWLDVVRFADTIGYHSDNPRNVWPYRDYVIKSFNENKPFDRFTKEQIAGDLLPDSGQEEKVGSAFNRLLLSTEEGGAQEKDYELRMLTDRVRSIGTGWLGQTVGCAQCHDHKFDPITQKDFYTLGAFFADIKEPILGRREDGMLVPDEKQKVELARLEGAAKKLQEDFDGPHPELADAYKAWQQKQREMIDADRLWTALKPATVTGSAAKNELLSDGSTLVKGGGADSLVYNVSFTNSPNPVSALRLEALPHDSLKGKGPGRSDNGNFVLTEIFARVIRANGDRVTIPFVNAKANHEQANFPAKAAIDGQAHDKIGWAILPEVGKAHQIVLELAQPIRFDASDRLEMEMTFYYGTAHAIGRFRVSATSSYDDARKPIQQRPPQEIIDLVGKPNRNDAEEKKLFAIYKGVAPELATLRKSLADARGSYDTFEKTLPRVLVSAKAEKPRTVRVLPRGNFLVETGDIVGPAFPGYLKKTEGAPNRLDLANWLVSRDNPLTARVFVNRLWKQFFGIGLSKVLDDLGSQGEAPVNPELLDYLAAEFMDSGWDVKHMVRLIVNSATYKQISIPTKELRARDPYNRDVAVQSRWRVDAEIVRDNALAISGLLVKKIGGPSVKPYQPDGYWENLNFPVRTYDASKGEDQYRRGLYTWWQRSYAHPSMLAFDAPSREECTAERNRSMIPQQALVLLNDPTYVEASRAFAARILKESNGDAEARIKWAWRQALCRQPTADELTALQALLKKHLDDYGKNGGAAKELLSVGYAPKPADLNDAELAAWTNVARAILNLYESVTRS